MYTVSRLIPVAAAAAVLAFGMPDAAHATQSAGMPWSGGVNQLSNEAKAGLAFIFILLGSVGGFVEYMNNGQLSMLMTLIGRAGIVIGVIGGLATFATIFGMGGVAI